MLDLLYVGGLIYFFRELSWSAQRQVVYQVGLLNQKALFLHDIYMAWNLAFICRSTTTSVKPATQRPQQWGLNFLCPVSLTHKSGFTRDVQTFITSAATTGMSFSEMGKHMATLRLTKYLDSFAEFKIRLKYYLESAQSNISSSSQQTAVCPEFSSFDDNTGYNETVQPTDQYLQRLWWEAL